MRADMAIDPTAHADTKEEEAAQRRSRKRRILAIAFLVLLVGALALTPPLVNVNRYRRRIATTMTQSLGRPVHLDNVSVHLLPWPGLTLQNLVVSEDPAFGYEPVIRANKVVANVRIGSLWRRQIEFSTIRFEVDEHGSGPSVNLVRNAQGKWNLEEVLMQASRIDTAPTSQRKAGPAPRFPYIEATGARLNIKLGNEKMPYSLTDADFALWLPSAQQWRVRLQGKPTRTDSNVSEAGLLRVEGSMHRADQIANVPVDLHGSWRGSPLGEASRLLMGEDAGWRGTLFLESSLAGKLGNANLTTHLQLNDLRRAEFVPSNMMDITLDCVATADITKTMLANAQCNVPIDKAASLTMTADAVDLQHPEAAVANAQVDKLPANWVFDWARLFSPRISATLQPPGTVTGELDWVPETQGWIGSLIAEIPSGKASGFFKKASEPVKVTDLQFEIDTSSNPKRTDAALLRLDPVTLRQAPSTLFTVAGRADAKSYQLQLTGSGTEAQVRSLADAVPPLSEGLDTAFGKADHAETPHSIALTCSRLWGGTQTCEPLLQPEPAKKPARPKHTPKKTSSKASTTVPPRAS